MPYSPFNETQKSYTHYWKIVSILILLVGISIGGLYAKKTFFKKTVSETYQAYFLVNGQVYFGKNAEKKDGITILKNVYYLQVIDDKSLQNQENPSGQSRLSLIKLGSELHGPTDTLYINNSQVLFYEDLRPDSKVLQSIVGNKTSI